MKEESQPIRVRPGDDDAISGARTPTPEALRDLICTSLDADQADDVVVIPLEGKTSFADYMVIASGRSTRHVGAMADHLIEKLKAVRAPAYAAEGRGRSDWVLIDGGDVIVHLFRPEVRAFYNLEKMWASDLAVEAATPGDAD